jgi:predicted aspartyl protease
MLIDTGADATLLPRSVVNLLGLSIANDQVYELAGFDGSITTAQVVRLEMVFLSKNFRGQFLVTDQEYGILGRNILNAVNLLFDGPNLSWDEIKRQ